MPVEFPVFPFSPDFENGTTELRSAMVDILELGSAPKFIAWPDLRTERTIGASFAIHGRADIRTAKAFWSARGGQHDVFLLPTWTRDFLTVAEPANGDGVVNVQVADYAGTLIPNTRPDTVGRYIFGYHPVSGLHVARVIRALELSSTTSAIEIDPPVPFEPNEATVWGFALLVRFAEDECRWHHLTEDIVTADLKFRTTRQMINRDQTLTLGASNAIFETQPFTTVEQTVANNPLLRNDMAFSYGPATRSIVQDTQFTDRWAAWIGTSQIRLGKQAEGTIWPPQDDLGEPSELFPGGKPADLLAHISLAFDANCKEVIAWQSDPTLVKIRRLFNGDLVEASFAGQWPVLFFNGSMGLGDGDSDVICYYLRPGESVIFARAQRDNFTIEYIACLTPAKPFYLVKADRVGHKEALTMIDDGFRLAVFTSDNYPDPPPPPFVRTDDAERAGLMGMIISDASVYFLTLLEGDLGGGESAPAGIVLGSASVYLALIEDAGSADDAGASGLLMTAVAAYTLAIIDGGLQADKTRPGTQIQSGSYAVCSIDAGNKAEKITPTGMVLKSATSYAVAIVKIPDAAEKITPTGMVLRSASAYELI